MADNAVRTLMCLIEGDSSLLVVEPTGSMDMMDLKDLIKEERKNGVLSSVDATDLTLWKVDLAPRPMDELKQLTGKNVPGSVKLEEGFDTISAHWPEATSLLHILVELPSVHATSLQLRLSPTTSAEIFALWSAVNIYMTNQGNFGRPSVTGSLNCLSPLVLGFKNEFHELDKYFEEAPTDVGRRDRISSSDQLWHFASSLLLKGWNEGNIKEDNVRWVFDHLGWYFHSVLDSREKHAFRGDWPFKLIVTVESEQKKQYRYTPRNDFHVSVGGLVHLMVEVQSEKNESDRYRMLLQGACAARLGRKICQYPFIVMALYIENTGRVTRYFLFQHDDADMVSYVSDVQYWMRPSELFKAMFEMYNLVSIILDRPQLEGTQRTINLLSSGVLKHFKEVIRAKGAILAMAFVMASTSTTIAGLSMHSLGQGTRLQSNDEDENGWAPLVELKPTVRHAIRSGGTSVVVKLLRPGSNELPILQYLHSFTSSCNHIIPLHGTLKLDVGTFILLPEATPLGLGFALEMFRNKGADFSRQLIEGVAYLHRCDIAHLDIKPQNIVAVKSRLFIIDFDISVRVDGPDALIDRWCGTPEWMAPEIGDQDGPKCLYSPIRADLWSCGLVLRYLASKGVVKDNRFETLTEQLLNKNPRLRPLLDQQSLVSVASFERSER